eukprot:scaffold491570_cov45-Prasinocladus_malaysianus.AAC.2
MAATASTFVVPADDADADGEIRPAGPPRHIFPDSKRQGFCRCYRCCFCLKHQGARRKSSTMENYCCYCSEGLCAGHYSIR